MKKSTGILFLIALVLAASVYFYERKRPPSPDATANSQGARPTWNVKREDIRQITLTRSGTTMSFDLKNDGWHITQPISGFADQAALADLADTLSFVPMDQSIGIPSAADLAKYGLANPGLSVEFKTQDGKDHKLQIGGKDFSNLEVYAYVDGAKNVTLVSNVIVNSADKPLSDFRDHSVLDVNPFGVTSFELDNQSGTMSAQKDIAGWNFVKPVATPGSTASISDLFGNLRMAMVAAFVDDNPSNLSKYGLDKPAIRFRVGLSDGTTKELLIGKKGDTGYDADSSGIVVRVPEAVRTLLSQSLSDLRAKVLFPGLDENVARIEVHNQNGIMSCVRDASGALNIERAASQEGTGIATVCPDFMGALERAPAAKIYDQPPPDLAAKLTKPVIEVKITDQVNKNTDIQISAVSGNSVYGRSDAGPSIYEFDKQAFDVLRDNPSPAK